MNRMEEFNTLLAECEREIPELEGTLDRAYAKKRKKNIQIALRSLGSIAACFAIFVLLVNFCAPVAYACSRVPGLRELAEAVTFSRSLSDAVDNEFVQPMDLSQSANGITAEIAYLIVDQKQVNVFYRLSSEEYPILSADPDVYNSDGSDLHHGLVNYAFDLESGELGNFTIDFTQENVPDSLLCSLKVWASGVSTEEAEPVTEQFPDTEDIPEPAYLAEFEFLLEFDPLFTAAGKLYEVNQTVEIDGQKLTVTEVEVYPSNLRINVLESADNTAWIQTLEYYIETDSGIRFDSGSNGLIATGSGDNPYLTSYRAESTYFYNVEQLKIVITGAKFLEKSHETTYVNLVTGETGPLPQGAAFESALREGDDWIVSFRADWTEGIPMYQLFQHRYYDPEGNEYELNMWSGSFGEKDENGKFTYFLDTFPLKDYPYDEVWLTPMFSYRWTADTEIAITVE